MHYMLHTYPCAELELPESTRTILNIPEHIIYEALGPVQQNINNSKILNYN